MRKITVFILFLMTFLLSHSAVSAQVEKVRISEAEIDYLARAIAVSYPEISYGGRVAVAAVVLNRTETVGFPDSVSGAVMSLAAEGEFSGVGKIAGRVDGEVYRVSMDAVMAAVGGADPTSGGLYFESVDSGKWRADLRFNDSTEDGKRREMQNYFREKYGTSATIIDGIGFLGE